MTHTCQPIVDGVPYVQWIHTLFGDCVYGWRDSISVLLGYLSIFCWLNAQMPQVIKNYRLHDAESLSFTFLTIWLIGDVANFIGCIETNQLRFQLYLSIYFIIIDTVLCMQWLYYVKFADNRLRQWLNPEEPKSYIYNVESTCSSSSQSRPLYDRESQLKSASLSTANQPTEQTQLCGQTDRAPKYTQLLVVGVLSLSVTTPTITSRDMSHVLSDEEMLWVGRFFAWLCTFLYLSSRLPQIAQNFRRRSVEGLSMALFFFAAMGNLTYTLSIFTNPHATRQSLLEAVPYIMGSAGTLMFDTVIFGQYLTYTYRKSRSTLTIA
ncbi:PQ loop repeat-domain-containing protein [Radiomyces spectabilis]|uniref:PQ loop repeat-domain-containing protein n=1 Tax=Radiomyces spectabilis TaxID=64574 RepID=UPI00221FC160|nr:PQ loop repeat-domain-containing protein [Radiomyces spectabilis]KAI8393829.1 PQ loop repeat-domain-containing protein [Radiomyces spectabilis]